jgi:hypothetical protein
MTTRRRTARQTRKARKDMLGIALIAASLTGFLGMGYGAYKIDEARGITVCQSLAGSGFGNKEYCL